MDHWIYALDQLVVIRPEAQIMHNVHDGISIDDPHIVYKYDDFDRSDYPHTRGTTTCGVDQSWIHHQDLIENDHLRDDIDTNHHIHHRNLLQTDSVLKHPPISSFVSSHRTRCVELAVVNDPAMIQRYKDLLERNIGEMNYRQRLFL